MTLKYQVDSLEGINEAAHGFYKETEGGFVLDVAGVVPEGKFNEVNQRFVDAQTEAKRRRGTVERVTQKLGLEDAAGLDEAIESLMSGKGKGKEEQEAVIQQIRQEADAKVSEASKRLMSIQSKAAKSELKASLAKIGFHPEIVDDITSTAMARVKIDDEGGFSVLSEEGNPLAGSGRDGYATLADLAKELAAAKPSFLVDAGKGGGGKPPASGSSNGGAKTITRQSFDAMSHSARADFAKSGGKVVD